ncbi:Cof-type HAD-IIB family hydrolase [Streptococcus cuniculi]|uniref:HAD family phosphatase n=1 Tax=Streptococcus cuniculi TaxID=1432788 RepID=A0A4Y9J9L2_9STRE|nr:Cof-type HAD-IIB family hydrolase [Streptococcus cuniculi]MBF0778489.1 HAD family phosphatase [Streptococcus cuniculi]TFU97582.1 HAD family phosphatase [Streptococcus cuniculi]
MKKKMIALDLDGTLLNRNSQLSAFTIETIRKVQEAGHTVIIATGRPYRMARHYYRELGLTTPMINFNGSLIHIPDQRWEWEQNIRIDKQYLLDFLKEEERFEADFIAGEYKHKFFITQNYLYKVDPALLGVDQITPDTLIKPERITSDPHSILMQTRATDKYALADDINRYFNDELELNTWGGPLNILEACAKGVTKASALTYLLDHYRMEAKDLIAFGDEHNDIQMLSLAGTGYAMKNASDTLIPYADCLTSYTNDEDGVARELQALFLD